MLDCEIYEAEYEFFMNYNPDDDIFDLSPDNAHQDPYWWEL